MRRLLTLGVVILFAQSSGSAFGQAGPDSKYAGQEQREIKSLSREDIRELRRGGGWGLAKPAELNGLPGPVHLLELKDRIPLSPDQIAKISAIYEDMRMRAISQGKRLIGLERQLETLFRNAPVSDTDLRALLAESAEVRGRLRYTHLSAHLAVSEFLTDTQVARYNALRGYEGSALGGAPDRQATPHGKRHQHSD